MYIMLNVDYVPNLQIMALSPALASTYLLTHDFALKNFSLYIQVVLSHLRKIKYTQHIFVKVSSPP